MTGKLSCPAEDWLVEDYLAINPDENDRKNEDFIRDCYRISCQWNFESVMSGRLVGGKLVIWTAEKIIFLFHSGGFEIPETEIQRASRGL